MFVFLLFLFVQNGVCYIVGKEGGTKMTEQTKGKRKAMAAELLAEMPHARPTATGGGLLSQEGGRRGGWEVGALDALRSAGEGKPKSGVEAAVAMPVSGKALFSNLQGKGEERAAQPGRSLRSGQASPSPPVWQETEVGHCLTIGLIFFLLQKRRERERERRAFPTRSCTW